MGEGPNERAVWLGCFVIPHEMALRRWLISRRFQGIDVDDVIQETYVVLSELKSVEHIVNPMGYMFKVAYSIVVAQLKRSQVVSITTALDLDEIASAVAAPSPESQVGDREELALVQEVINALPLRVRDVVVLRKIEGASQREVAQRLGISENIVEKCVAQGVRTLLKSVSRGGKSSADTPPDGDARPSAGVVPINAGLNNGNKKSGRQG